MKHQDSAGRSYLFTTARGTTMNDKQTVNPLNRVTLGERYTDDVTGFTGTATVRVEYLYAPARVQLEAPSCDNKPGAAEYFDEPRLSRQFP